MARVIFADLAPDQAIFETEFGGTDSSMLGEIGKMLEDDPLTPPLSDASAEDPPEHEQDGDESDRDDKDAA